MSEPSSGVSDLEPSSTADTHESRDEHESSSGSAPASAEASDGPPRRKRKRRRRRKGPREEGATEQTATADAREPQHSAPRTPSPAPASGSSESSGHVESSKPPQPSKPQQKLLTGLTAGLFSHIDAREVPCKVDGCRNTWSWTAEEQIRAWGQPPPKRMCAEHSAAFHQIGDMQVPCANPGCDKTWTWPKSVQVAQLQKTGSAEPPQRVCDTCRQEERDLADAQVSCKVDGCRRTWTWPRDAQLRHRAWLRRQATEGGAGPAEVEEAPAGDGKRRRNRRRNRKQSLEGPPRRMCDPCKGKLAKLVDRDTTCKVHGCTRTVQVDRDAQLRAWASLHTEDLDAEAPLPKRMCEVCREFCRLHPDREVACGRPGCERTWTYKTGAQLQAFLAGRLEDPIRLCDECSHGEFARQEAAVPHGMEIMPCVMPHCDGTWLYEQSMQIGPADDGDLPPDRMCAKHRAEQAGHATVAAADVGEPTPGPTPPS